jgi:hypothetical protein
MFFSSMMMLMMATMIWLGLNPCQRLLQLLMSVFTKGNGSLSSQGLGVDLEKAPDVSRAGGACRQVAHLVNTRMVELTF